MGQQLGANPLSEHIWDTSKHFPENLTTVFKSPSIVKSEKIFWFLTTLVAFVIAHMLSIMQTGFLMANTCVH